jgi:hypothetical protein
MYGWGDDMSDWAQPSAYSYKGPAKAKKARAKAAKAQKKRGGRHYAEKSGPRMDLVDPRGKTISTTSENPVVVAVDVTGSMEQWPFEIFDRLPLLYQTLSQYRPDVEVSFIAIGDATCDRWPLQVCDFGAGIELEDKLAGLYGEGGGGGQARESYELFAYFMLHHVRAPRAQRPFLIFYGDEGYYPRVDKQQVKHYLGDDLRESVDSLGVWGAIAESWNVFHLRKPYGGYKEAEIQAQWEDTLGAERVVRLDEEQRAVDLALGLVARSWGHFDDFEANMAARHSEAKVRALTGRVDDVDAGVLR